MTVGLRRSLSRRRVVSFGWELVDLSNDGAAVYYPVASDIDIISLDIDLATMLLFEPTEPGPLQVLCTGAVGRGGPPSFGTSGAAGRRAPSNDFGAVTTYNPSNLDVTVTPTAPSQDGFLALIVKAWSPAGGTASSTCRHVRITPNFRLRPGDYLGFHMEHSGMLLDAELQVVVGYSVRD